MHHHTTLTGFSPHPIVGRADAKSTAAVSLT
jgi:hypothetical protein